MQKKGSDLSLIEALVLFSDTLSDEVFKDGELTIPGIINGIRKFSYNRELDDETAIHNYSLTVDYSQTAYSGSKLEIGKITEFDVFVEEISNGLKVMANKKVKDINKPVAENKEHLIKLIKKEIKKNGNECNLNHIDVSNIEDMSHLFSIDKLTKFNGNISKWDVSNVKDMEAIFSHSSFSGDISKWDVSNVEDMTDMFNGYKNTIDISNWDVSNVKTMYQMFANSSFNGDISKWDVSNVIDMFGMFGSSSFNGDLSNWKPYKLDDNQIMFQDCPAPIPYWDKFDKNRDRRKAIECYQLHQELDNDNIPKKRIKV